METPPFGHYHLSPWRETLRRLAGLERSGTFRRLFTSLARRAAQFGRSDPFDVEIFAGQQVRLYPRTNRSEKRVFVNAEAWDKAERARIIELIRAAPADRPFHFVDAGANTGLYSLFVFGAARAMGRQVEILAIEPDPTNRQRLVFNLKTSGAADRVIIIDKALGDDSERGQLAFIGDNRRSPVASDAAGTDGERMQIDTQPLQRVLEEAGMQPVDLLKINNDGAGEAAVFGPFFANSPRSLFPRAIILETISESGGDALALCLAAGYRTRLQTRRNNVLTLEERDG